ncbi:hypothetical protein SLEP1_g12115 [Rubroshorea leprosula]|nr:hypothetical protein SLEP1_g12115 [Rubroshorea leprosula]
MGEEVDPEHQLMVAEGFPHSMQIDPQRAREDGVILDFAGPNFICVDNFAFGAVARYVQINKEQECWVSPHPPAFKDLDVCLQDDPGRETLTWDDAIRKSTQEFQHRSYNLFTCNCHSFVANNLNRMGFRSGGWNVVNLAAFIFLKGRWVDKASVLQSFLPFVIVSGIGLLLGGTTFLTFLVFFAFLLVGWFLIGEEGQVISCHTVDSWNQHLLKGKESNKLQVIKEWEVEAMPTFIFLKEGTVVDKVVGAKREELQQTIAKHMAIASA